VRLREERLSPCVMSGGRSGIRSAALGPQSASVKVSVKALASASVGALMGALRVGQMVGLMVGLALLSGPVPALAAEADGATPDIAAPEPAASHNETSRTSSPSSSSSKTIPADGATCRLPRHEALNITDRAAPDSDGQTPAAASAPALDITAVHAAASAVAADPLLGGTDKVRYLRFKDTDKKEDKKTDTSMAGWWIELIKGLSTGMRIAIWLLGAGVLIWIFLRLRDWVQLQRTGTLVAAVAPTHVGSLDIRPESLPEDIGAAARALWQQGQPRAALSLLYRGALSRLVHVHGVPIRAASTESDCLALAQPRLSPASHRYLSQLISGWQIVAYAQREVASDDFEALCRHFDERLTQGATP
jgi:Domain of unknown function (DUF4129)